MLEALHRRLEACSLQAHPQKTRKVYCKDGHRRVNNFPVVSFDFLGYTFRGRKQRNRYGQNFNGFGPSMGKKPFQRIKEVLRKEDVIRWSGKTMTKLAEELNPRIIGWLNFYGHFGRRDGVYKLRDYLEQTLLLWAKKKYKRLKRSYRKAKAFLALIKSQNPFLFAHWNMKRG